MDKTTREKGRALLREYEQAIIKAADIRREKFKQAQQEFDNTQQQARQKYREAKNNLS